MKGDHPVPAAESVRVMSSRRRNSRSAGPAATPASGAGSAKAWASAPAPGAARILASLILPVYLPTTLVMLGGRTVVPFLPLFARELGAGLGMVGAVAAMRGLGALLFDLPAGLLINRFGKLPVMIVSLSAAIVIALVTGFIRGVAALAVLTLLDGGMMMCWLMSIQTHVRQVVPRARRGRALSLIGGVLRVGALLGPILGGFLARAHGLRVVYFAQSLVCLVALVVLARGIPRLRAQERGAAPIRRTSAAPQRVPLSRILSDHWRTLVLFGAIMIGLQLLRTARDLLFPLWGDYIGLDPAAIGLAVGIPVAVELGLFVPAGQIMDRLGRKWALVPCLVLMAAALALVPAAGSFAGLLAVGLVAALGNGLGSGINLTLGADLAPREGAALFLGLWHVLSDIGSISGPLLIGSVAQLAGLGLAPLFAAALGLSAAALMVFRGPETLRGRR